MNPTEQALQLAEDENFWAPFRREFNLRPDTVYLNHGSFGITLNCVRRRRDELLASMESQPMDFYLRQYEPLLAKARQSLASFVGTEAGNLAFVDNATYGMNVVMNSVPLAADDEVLMTNQVYGAVRRMWEAKSDEIGFKLVEVAIPDKIESKQQFVDLVVSAITARTKLAVLSHIVSLSALILPIREICLALRERGVLSCIDGPHAPLQLDLRLNYLGCDFYTASLHKWLCAPLGTGFLFVKPDSQHAAKPPIIGWGRLLPATAATWNEEHTWLGTRNQTGCLAVPAAIEFFRNIGLENVRCRMNYMASIAEKKLCELFDTEPIANRNDGWYCSMAHIQLPDGDWAKLQDELWVQAAIEVPIWELKGRWWIRVSCHLYNNLGHIDYLVNELKFRL